MSAFLCMVFSVKKHSVFCSALLPFGDARLRGKIIKIHCPCSFKHTLTCTANSSANSSKKGKRLRQSLIELLLGPPFLCYRLDSSINLHLCFLLALSAGFSPQELLVWVNVCVSTHASERECLRTSVLPLYSRQSAGFCPGPWSVTSAGRAVIIEDKPFSRWHTLTDLDRTRGPPHSFIISHTLLSIIIQTSSNKSN